MSSARILLAFAVVVLVTFQLVIVECKKRHSGHLRGQNYPCGFFNQSYHPELRIQGGAPIERYEFPSAVHLMAADTICSGAIISEIQIVTAAHCVKGVDVHDIRVWPGQLSINRDEDNYHNVTKVCIFKEFEEKSLYGDIAILRIDGYFRMSHDVWSACWSMMKKDPGKEVQIVGSGQEIPGEKSKNIRVMKAVLVECPKEMKLGVGFICSKSSDAMVCDGDAGGGVYIVVDGRHNIIGINSHQYGNCTTPFQSGLNVATSIFHVGPKLEELNGQCV